VSNLEWDRFQSVSYTNLTLPTIYTVQISVVDVSVKKKHPTNDKSTITNIYQKTT